tara:strand:- start:105 stop:239 length:135 start_codon:yes stop_codon:yes gene_type:complete
MSHHAALFKWFLEIITIDLIIEQEPDENCKIIVAICLLSELFLE